MQLLVIDSPDAQARVVAMFVKACGWSEADARFVLDRLDAFNGLGVTPQRLFELAAEFPPSLAGGQGAVRLSDLQLVDQVLSEVREPARRREIVRLVADLLTARGHVEPIARVLYDQMLNRWRLQRFRAPFELRAARSTS